MGDEKEYRAKIERLDSDGSNWVSYKARLQSAFLSHEWEEHLTETAVMPTYTNLGNINNVTPHGLSVNVLPTNGSYHRSRIQSSSHHA